MKRLLIVFCLSLVSAGARAQVLEEGHEHHEGHEGHEHHELGEGHEGHDHDPASETPGALFREMTAAIAAQPGQRVLYKFTGLVPRLGLATQKGLFAEVGLSLDFQQIGYTGASEFPSFGYSNLRPYVSGEIMVGSHRLGGGKAGVEYIRSTPVLGMALGGDVSYLTDGSGRALLVTPRLMLSLVWVELYYGYNFFVRNDFPRWIGHNRFGVSVTLNPRFWSRKKQIGEEYYDSYFE
jgi:hypothetical protein